MKPTGKEIVAYIRMYDRSKPVSEVERRVLPGSPEMHDAALERGYLDYARWGWFLTEAGTEFLRTLKGDYAPIKSRWGTSPIASALDIAYKWQGLMRSAYGKR